MPSLVRRYGRRLIARSLLSGDRFTAARVATIHEDGAYHAWLIRWLR
jgi:hypothetical protein